MIMLAEVIQHATGTEKATFYAVAVAIVGVFGTLGGQWLLMSRARQDREQDRLDKLAEAEITSKYRAKIEKELLQTKSIASTGVRRADAALVAANNLTEKNTEATKIATAALGVAVGAAVPKEVIVKSDPDHPVHTTQS